MTPGDDELGRGEIEAALETRRELGHGTTPSWSTGSRTGSRRAVEHRVAEQVALQQRRSAAVAGAGARQLALGIISLVAVIPISIALGVNDAFLATAGDPARHRRRQPRPCLAEPG